MKKEWPLIEYNSFGASKVIVVVKSVRKTGRGDKHCALGESNNERRYVYDVT